VKGKREGGVGCWQGAWLQVANCQLNASTSKVKAKLHLPWRPPQLTRHHFYPTWWYFNLTWIGRSLTLDGSPSKGMALWNHKLKNINKIMSKIPINHFDLLDYSNTYIFFLFHITRHLFRIYRVKWAEPQDLSLRLFRANHH